MRDEIPDRFDKLLGAASVETTFFLDDGTYPNNEELPVLVYEGAFLGGSDRASAMERVFRAHNWRGQWRNGIFSYHHYHSTAHEVLGVARGAARVQLGGPEGAVFDLEAGNVVVLPAGVAHKNLGADRAFLVVGAYPDGQSWDLLRGQPGERPDADRNIQAVALPEQDPVYGQEGPLTEHWGGTN